MCAVSEENRAQIYIIGNVITFLWKLCMYPLFFDGNKYLNIIMCEEEQRRHLESPVLMIIITGSAYRRLS